MRLQLRSLLAAVAMMICWQSISHGSDLLYVTLNNATVATFDVSSNNAATIAASKTTIASGFGNTGGLVVDAGGNVFVADPPYNKIQKISSGGGVSQFATGLNNPNQMVSDSANNLYVANSGANTISKIAPDGTVSTFASGLNYPLGLTIDNTNTLYVGNANNNSISSVSSSGTVSAFSSNVNAAYALAYNAGYVYETSQYRQSIYKIDSGGTPSVFATLATSGFLAGITFDSSGNLYLGVQASTGYINKYDSAGNLLLTFSTGSAAPKYMAFAPVQVPEPSTYALAAIATGVITAIARRRKAGRA